MLYPDSFKCRKECRHLKETQKLLTARFWYTNYWENPSPTLDRSLDKNLQREALLTLQAGFARMS